MGVEMEESPDKKLLSNIECTTRMICFNDDPVGIVRCAHPHRFRSRSAKNIREQTVEI